MPIERRIVGSFESMLETKCWSFKDTEEYDKWLENNNIRKAKWSEGFREYFNLTNVQGRLCTKNPRARLGWQGGHLLFVPVDLVMKALVFGSLP